MFGSVRCEESKGEIYIYDTIGQDWFGEGITAKSVIDALGTISGHAHVRINSPGGVADEGIAIYNALKRHPAGVTTYVDSLAASAASIVALAGSKRVISKGGRFMIHRAMTIAMGNANDLDQVANMLKSYDKSLVEIYSEYIKDKTPAQIMNMMDDETWFNVQDSIDAGLATDSGEDVPDAQPTIASWFRKPPENCGKPVQEYSVMRAKAKLLKMRASS
jgi:ATP-dependent protease ClpP protease subunit